MDILVYVYVKNVSAASTIDEARQATVRLHVRCTSLLGQIDPGPGSSVCRVPVQANHMLVSSDIKYVSCSFVNHCI